MKNIVLAASMMANGIGVLPPPPAYTGPFNGPLIEKALPLSAARSECARRGVRADACSWKVGGRCYIVYPVGAGAPVQNREAYRRHEIAHCNGWNHGRHGRAHGKEHFRD